MLDLILYILAGIITITGIAVFLSNLHHIFMDLIFYVSASLIIIAGLTVLLAILYLIIKFIKIIYYMAVNLPITRFINNLPDESYMIYENGDFFIRYIEHDLKDFTTHEKLKIFEEFKLGEPITKNIPLNIKLKLMKLKEINPKVTIIKTGKRFFIVKNHTDFAFCNTENPKKWFEKINKIL